MDWTIGSRIKLRNKERLEEVMKRKPAEEEAPVSSRRKRKRRRRRDHDSDIEDITEAYNNNLSTDVTHNVSSSSGGVRRRRRKDHDDSDIEDITETYFNNLPTATAAEVNDSNNVSAAAEVTDRKGKDHDDSDIEDITETYFNTLPTDVSAAEVTDNNYQRDLDFDLVDITVTYTKNLDAEVSYRNDLPAQLTDNNLSGGVRRTESEQNMEEGLFNVRVMDADMSVPGSSGLSIMEKLSDVAKTVPTSSGLCDENLDLDMVKSAPSLSIKEKVPDEVLDLDVNKSVPKLSDEIQDLDVNKSVPSSSESSIKQKLCAEIMDVIRSAASSSGLGIKEKLPEEILDVDVDVVKSVPKLSDDVLDMGVIKSVPSSSGSSNKENESLNSDVVKSVTSSSESEEDTCVKDKCSSEMRGVEVAKSKSVPAEIEIISDSESETTKVRHSAKKKLSFAECSRVLDSTSESSEEEGTSEANSAKKKLSPAKDDVSVESLSSSSSFSSSSGSSSSSSSSSEDEVSSKEVGGDTDDDDSREASSPIRKVSEVRRKPLGRYKRTGPCSITPRKQFQKIRKLNHPEEEEERFQPKPKEFQRIQKFNRQEEEEEEESFQAKPKEFKRIQKLNHREEKEDRFQAKPIKEDKRIQKFNFQEEEERFQDKPRNEDKRIQKFHCREEEEEQQHKEVERVTNQHSSAVFTCAHCGKENTGVLDSDNSFFRPHAITRGEDAADDNDLNKDEYVPVNTGKAPEKPSTSRPETENPKTGKEVITPAARPSTSRPETVKAKEIQAPEMPPRPEIQFSLKTRMPVTAAEGLATPAALVNEPVDNESASSISSGDESGYDSEPSLKEKEAVKSNNNNSGWRMMDGSRKEVDLFRLLVNSVRENDRLSEEEEDDILVSSPEEQSEEPDERRCDEDGFLIVRPPPLVEMFGVVEPQTPPVVSEAQIEEDKMWEELAFYTKSNEVDLQLSEASSFLKLIFV